MTKSKMCKNKNVYVNAPIKKDFCNSGNLIANFLHSISSETEKKEPHLPSQNNELTLVQNLRGERQYPVSN